MAIDLYYFQKLQKLLHGPINIFDKDGTLLHTYEQGISQPVAPRIFMGKGRDVPYIQVDDKGVAYAVIYSERWENYIVLGKIRMYLELSDDEEGISYCGKEEFIAITEICWKFATGKEMTHSLWDDIMEADAMSAKRFTSDVLKYLERGEQHNPILQELREQDSIRRGDLQALEEGVNEFYDGEIGDASKDLLRHYKNIAVWMIYSASRSAILGGMIQEKALTMCDSYVRNVEENIMDPLEVERAAREAQFMFAREVRDLHQSDNSDRLSTQVRDYVYTNVTERLQVADIAKKFGVNANYLSEHFSKREGIPLKKYIIDEKIKFSEHLLKFTNQTIGEISETCGFGSQGRFAQYFRERLAVTPRQYRKRFHSRKG